MTDIASYLSERRTEVEDALLRVLPREGSEPLDLVSAVRYSTLAGGKRLRPILCLSAAEACANGGLPPRGELVEAAAALELFHTYSLIHDDLPCMDDDRLRRGKPTCHVVYGEATALLAGDSLQTLGFFVLSSRPSGDRHAAARAEAVRLTSEAIGIAGMAGGQALDLFHTGRAGDGREDRASLLATIHSLKTGRLLRVSVLLGALYAGASDRVLDAASRYGEALGLVFQIADDLLDVTADAATLGKTAGKDSAQNKLTYPSVFGLEGARRERDRALADARAAAAEIEDPPGVLRALADYAALRDR